MTETLPVAAPARLRTPGPRRGTAAARQRPVKPQPSLVGRRCLYNHAEEPGVTIYWHDVAPGENFEPAWPAARLVLWLNVAGAGAVQCGKSVLQFEPLTAAFFVAGEEPLRAERNAGQAHRFVSVEFPIEYLRRQLARCDGALHPLVEASIGKGAAVSGLGPRRWLTPEQERWVARLACPPVSQGARDLWYQGQALQLMAEFFFERQGEDELFCDRQKRLARERVERVTAILRRDLVTPPALEAIGREVGCSPFHLSRTFSQEAGMTIPQLLRKLRMERAAELLRGGKHNVTEAALEVGYSSLSHFSQAFCQTMGCCPGLYPLKAQATAKK